MWESHTRLCCAWARSREHVSVYIRVSVIIVHARRVAVRSVREIRVNHNW